MFGGILAFVKSMLRAVVKFGNWVRRGGKNGDNPVSPLSAEWLSTGWSFVVIVTFGVAEGLYNFVVNYLLEGVAFLFNMLVDILLDLWRSDHKFTRWAVTNICSFGIAVFSTLWMVTKWVGAVAAAALVFLFEIFR